MTRRLIRLRKVSEPHPRVGLTFATASDTRATDSIFHAF
jgi:hypothetical protein